MFLFFECLSRYHHEEANNDFILKPLENNLSLEDTNKTSLKAVTNNSITTAKTNIISDSSSINSIENDNSSYFSEESISKERHHDNVVNIFKKENANEQQENSKINEFHKYLKDVSESDPKRYANLLTNLPRFVQNAEQFDNRSAENEEMSNTFPMVSETKDAFLLKFLRAGNNRFETATKILINYILLMRDHPKYYSSSLKPDVIQKVYDEKIHTVLPVRDKFNRRVFIWRPGKWNPDFTEVCFTDCYCAMYMLCEMMAQEPTTQIEGCTVVCEGSNIGFKQLRSMCIEDIRNSANFIQVMQFNCIMT